MVANTGSPNTRRGAAVVLLFVLMLGIAAYLRCYRLSEQGILGVDEGRYALDALSGRAEIDVVLGLFRGKYAEMRGGPEFLLADYLVQADELLHRQHPFSPKPGFTLLSGLVMILTGNVIGACSYVEAVSGVVTIALLFGFVRDVRNTRAALIAAALLSFSVYHIYYSRNAYPQCSAGALFMLAVWCHYRWYRLHRTPAAATVPPAHWAWLFPCGVLLGLSFWFNYQIAGALPAIALVHCAGCVCARDAKSAARSALIGTFAIGCGFVAVLALAEALTYPLIVLFRSYGMAYAHATFFELLAPRLTGQSGVAWNFTGWPLFGYFLSVTDGPYYLVAILLPIGAALLHVLYRAARSPRAEAHKLLHPAAIYFVVPCAAICVVFSFKTIQGARTFVTALPFLFAVVGVAVDYVLRIEARVPRFTLAPAAACALITLFLYYPGRLNESLSIRSAYPEAMEYVRSLQPPAACAAWSAVLETYGVAEGVEARSVYTYANAGGPLPPVYLSDWQELYNRRDPDNPLALAPGAVPIDTFVHDFGRVFLSIEAFPSFGNTWQNIAWVDRLEVEKYRRILVYDSRDIRMVASNPVASN